MTDPAGPVPRLDERTLFREPLVWRADSAHKMWLVSELRGRQLHMRINRRFPDEPMYSLLVGLDETLDFDDLPAAWRREGPLSWD